MSANTSVLKGEAPSSLYEDKVFRAEPESAYFRPTIEEDFTDSLVWRRLERDIDILFPKFLSLFKVFFAIEKAYEAIPEPELLAEHRGILEMEYKAFLEMREKLLEDERYEGKWVAILDGELIDCDEDGSVLAKRVYEKHGYRPILIERIIEKERPLRFPSPRFR